MSIMTAPRRCRSWASTCRTPTRPPTLALASPARWRGCGRQAAILPPSRPGYRRGRTSSGAWSGSHRAGSAARGSGVFPPLAGRRGIRAGNDAPKQHPGHPRSVDVRHAIVMTHWSERPSDFILLPPPYERDLDDVRAVVAAADQFLRFHGADERACKVRQLKVEARQLLYQQAVFLARWTDEQGRPHAALQRWKLARREFSDQSVDGKDVQWAKGLEQRVAARPIKVPEPPSLHPPAPVVGRGAKP